METMTIKQANEECKAEMKKLEALHQSKVQRVKDAQKALKDYNANRKASKGVKLSDEEEKKNDEAHKAMIKEVKDAQAELKSYNQNVRKEAKLAVTEKYRGIKLDIKDALKKEREAKKQQKVAKVVEAPTEEVKAEAPVAVAAE